MSIYNNQKLKQVRRNLRRSQTEAEKLIWSKLRGKQFSDLKFYRQYSIGKYILDFYCPKIRLAIEIDGGQHDEANSQKYDGVRTTYLKQNGVKVVRFWNNEVLNNLEGVIQKLVNETTGP